MPAFRYQPIDPREVERRAKGSGDFNGFFSDQFKMYQVPRGENFVRILPPTWDNAKYFGVDVYVHFNIGPDHAAVLCPFKMSNQPCPLCDDRVRATRNDPDLAKELAPRHRIVCWMLDMRNEREGPQVWPMAPTVDTGISKVSKDRISGQVFPITDPNEGYNISFDRVGSGIGTKYDGFQRDTRPSSVDPRWLEFIAENPIPSILVYRDAEEIQALYQGVILPRAGDDDRGGRGRDSRGYDDRGYDDRRHSSGRSDRDSGYNERSVDRGYREPDRREPPPRDYDNDSRRQSGIDYSRRETERRPDPEPTRIQRQQIEEPSNVSPIHRQREDDRSLDSDRAFLQPERSTGTPTEQGAERVANLKNAFAARNNRG